MAAPKYIKEKDLVESEYLQIVDHDRVMDCGDARARIPLRVLDGPSVEVWPAFSAVASGQLGYVTYRHDADHLFGSLFIPEQELPLVEATKCAYQALFECCEQLGFPHFLRIWNYFDRINEGQEDAERYKQFCATRYDVLCNWPNLDYGLPAATAIGGDTPGLAVHFIAGKRPGMHLENPRQVAAWKYPREYGPRSPSFSRATIVELAHSQLLYLSGTASVVGHESKHLHDPLAQLEETMRNIESLLMSVHSAHPWLAKGIKVYVRNEADLAVLKQGVQQYFGADVPQLFLLGDICREELALEIEGVFERDI